MQDQNKEESLKILVY